MADQQGAQMPVDQQQQQQPQAHPATPAPPAPPDPVQALLLAVQTMAQGMQTLQQSMTVLTQSTQSKRYVEKPQPYKGKDATDARRFLAAFHHYGATAGNLLNYPDGKGGWNLDHSKWVACAMSLLQDEAAVWAMTEMEKIQVGDEPFNGNWHEFCEAFKARFETTDAATDAKMALKQLKQKTTVANYLQEFGQIQGRTGYSEDDLRDRFYDGLSTYIKDTLASSDRKIDTMQRLREAALDIDKRKNARDLEKLLEKGKAPFVPFWRQNAQPRVTPFAKDPNAMDIDASLTRNLFEFQNAMRGKCYGCGSTEHTKANGNHERDICSWCGKTGHREAVCQAKYLGRPKIQKLAATVAPAAPQETPAPPAAAAVASTSAPVDYAAAIQALVEQQAAMGAQLQAFIQSSF